MTIAIHRSHGRAVSEVIGVVLMVTITIIVAALVGSFAFGLNTGSSKSPAATFTFSYDEANDELTIRHETGNQILEDELHIRGDCDGCGNIDRSWADYAGSPASGSIDGESAVASGDSITLTNVGSAYDIIVVWQPEKGETSAPLGSDEGPDAS